MINHLLTFSIKLAKSAVYVPVIILTAIINQIAASISNKGEGDDNMDMNSTQLSKSKFDDSDQGILTRFVDFTDILKLVSLQYYFSCFLHFCLYIAKKVVKFFVVFGAFGFFSFIVTLFAYYLISLPKVIENDLSLSFSEDKQSQFAELYFNCTKKCSYLDSMTYEVILEFEVVKNEVSKKSGNFEVELNYLLDSQRYTVKKINFIEVNDYYVEMFFRTLYIPLNILGYKRNNRLEMHMVSSLDNTGLGLDYLDIKIKEKRLNIKNPKIIFVPYVGFIRNLLWSMRIVALPSIFFGFIIVQLFCYFCIKVIIYAYQTVTTTS